MMAAFAFYFVSNSAIANSTYGLMILPVFPLSLIVGSPSLWQVLKHFLCFHLLDILSLLSLNFIFKSISDRTKHGASIFLIASSPFLNVVTVGH